MNCPECGAEIDIQQGWECMQCSHVVRVNAKVLGRALIGLRIAKRYEVREVLGAGGLGVVFKGMDISSDTPCRIKFFLPDGEISYDELDVWFERWGEEIIELRHRNILSVRHTGKFAGMFFTISAYIEGQTLESLLARIGSLSVQKLKPLAEPLARGLAYAHQKGLYHFDFNPSNVLIGVDGIVRIMDFGPSRRGFKWASKPGAGAYLAPEQLKDGMHIDQQADVYAFAGVIMRILGLKPDTREAMENIDPYLKPIIARMRDPDVALRYKSISACVTDFEVLEEQAQKGFKTGHWAKSKAVWVKTIAVVFCAVAVFFTGRFVLDRGIDVSSPKSLKGALKFKRKTDSVKVHKNFSQDMDVNLDRLFPRNDRTDAHWKKDLAAKLDFLTAKHATPVATESSQHIGESKLFGMGRALLRELQKKLDKTDENFRWLSSQYDHSDPQMERVAQLRKELALEKTELVNNYINVFGFAKIMDTFPVGELPVWLQNYSNLRNLLAEHKWDSASRAIKKASECVVTTREQSQLREDFYAYYIRAAWYWFNKGEYARAKDLFDNAEKYAGNRRELAQVKKGYSSLFDHFTTKGLAVTLKGQWDEALQTYDTARQFVFDAGQQERLRMQVFDLYNRMVDQSLTSKDYEGASRLLGQAKLYVVLQDEIRKYKNLYFRMFMSQGMEQAYRDDFVSARDSVERAAEYVNSQSDEREVEKALLFLKKQEKLGFSVMSLLMQARQASADYDLVKCVEIARKVLDKDPENKEAKALIADPHPAEFTTPGGITFVYVLPGEFEMGNSSGEKDERPRHKVLFSRPFYIGKFEVSQAVWDDVMGDNPSRFEGENLPVDSVSWNDCEKFIKKLNEMVAEEKKSYRFRLPTEAEWEYACRAGQDMHVNELLDSVAWYDANSGLRPHNLGLKEPNAWGIFDMLGNVREWCVDYYKSDYYGTSPVKNPQGPAKGTQRVVRGGSWGNNSEYVRCCARFKAAPGQSYEYQGLRLALEIKD